MSVIESTGRYSLKYVNAIAARTLAEQIKMGITLGPVEVKDDAVNIRVDQIDNDIVHVLSLITGASGQLPNGNTFHGVVVDINSIRNINQPDLATFEAELEPSLEQLWQKKQGDIFQLLNIYNN